MACGIATTQSDQLYVEVPHWGLECLRPQAGNQMPAVVLQQLLAELAVASKEQPVLGQYNTGGATEFAELQAAV
ncbi:hypothetical protein D9M70_411180 [compost metagenome]